MCWCLEVFLVEQRERRIFPLSFPDSCPLLFPPTSFTTKSSLTSSPRSTGKKFVYVLNIRDLTTGRT